MKTEKTRKAFTIVELLTAITIIAILIGILMPALNMARGFARESTQRVQLQAIELGINAYKNDFGDYPPSHGVNGSGNEDYTYCGAQTLAEAMFGQDLLGFHSQSVYEYGDTDYYPANLDPTNQAGKDSLNSRKGLYMKRENVGVFKPELIYNDTGLPVVDSYVICDVFEAAKREMDLPNSKTKKVSVGTPVLYFRANTAAANFELEDNGEEENNIYNYFDNSELIGIRQVKNNNLEHAIDDSGEGTNFHNFITDPIALEASNLTRPVREDSFLLISAGKDGVYGTQDDICNFEPYFEQP